MSYPMPPDIYLLSYLYSSAVENYCCQGFFGGSLANAGLSGARGAMIMATAAQQFAGPLARIDYFPWKGSLS